MRQRDMAPCRPDIRITHNSFTCHQPADQSMIPGVSTRMTPNVHVAIMAGFMICLNSRYSMTLNRSLSALPGRNSQ